MAARVNDDDTPRLRPCFLCAVDVLDGTAIVAVQTIPGSAAVYRVPVCDDCTKRIAIEHREGRIL